MATKATSGATNTSLRILEVIKDENGAGVTEIANSIGISKSTAHDHLQTLRDNAFVIKDGGSYTIGLRFLDFGEFRRQQTPIYEHGQEEVDKLAAETGEQADLLVEEHGKGIYLYIAHGENALNLKTYEGTRVYLHATALGKVILAHLPEDHVSTIIDRHGMPAVTDNTITDRAALSEELDAIRDRGFAFNDEESTQGLRCVGVPVMDGDGNVAGAISVSGPTSRMSGTHYEEEIPDLLLGSANIIEINLTHA